MTAKEVKQVLDGIPKDMPVLIDEAYHHFVDDPAYGTVGALRPRRPPGDHRAHVLEDRGAGGDAHRLRAWRPPKSSSKMRPYSMGSVNALAKWGAVASLKDTAGQADVQARRSSTCATRPRASSRRYGYPTIPSQTNFFMVSLEGRTVQPVIEEFREEGHPRRPSVPADDQAPARVGRHAPRRWTSSSRRFKEIFPKKTATTMARG